MLSGLSQGNVVLRDARVVGTALRTDYGPDVAMMNMIIVAKSERGAGLGRKVMQGLMDGSGDRELRLVATTDGLPLYEKLGFEPEGVISQHQGDVTAVTPPEGHIETAGAEDLAPVQELDRTYLAADRSKLISCLAEHGEIALHRAPSGEVTGYAAWRRFGRGYVIGPIVAPDAGVAQDLIRYFATRHEGQFVRIDTDTTLGLAPWLETIGLARAGGGVKMRKNIKTEPKPVFGYCSQALG